MKVLGVHVHHNSSVCLFDDADLIYYNQEERVSRLKTKGGIPVKCLLEIKKIIDYVDVIVISAYNSDWDNSAMVAHYIRDELGIKFGEFFYYYKSHHLAHAFKAFAASNFSESLVVVWDGRGSNYNLTDGSVAFETTSVFHISYETGVKLVSKKLYRYNSQNKDINDIHVVYSTDHYFNNIDTSFNLYENYTEEILTKKVDIGEFYNILVDHLGFNSLRDQGKLMGLYSYGNENELLSSLILDNNLSGFTGNILNSELDGIDSQKYKFLETKKENKQTLFDLAYETQKGLEKIGFDTIQKSLETNLSKNLVLTGGVSLNIVANSFYKKNLPKDINLYVDPLCGDEGNCIGISQFYLYDKLKIKPKVINKIYLCGKEPEYKLNMHVSEQIFHDVDVSFVVEKILEENIVAIFQGKAEAGPRALGNRSLLFDPRIKDGKEIVNKVKKRESFRPFAASILLEEAPYWFDMSLMGESPHMMYSFEVLPEVKSKIPSVIHVDNTCRIQTVSKEQNYYYYRLIETFFYRTRVPILFNTSFNLAGDPIVETIDDALNTLRKSELEYLYLPEISKLIYIKNK